MTSIRQSIRAVPQKGRGEMVEAALRKAIVLGTFQPGAALREMDLAERFDCAQGTVREALMRLSEEGLVSRRARRDTHVAPASLDDMDELLRIRHDIECRAARRIIAADDPALLPDLGHFLQSMRLAALEGDEYALLEQDCLFHLRLFETAATPVVEPVLQRCLVHTQRYKVLNTTPDQRDLLNTANRHVAIIEAVATGRAEELARALSHHIATIVDFGPEVFSPAGAAQE